ncbi:CsbD family protein [Streptomyces sp. NPDC052052]|uniref:CsbD family protein n=1 Tax=Streptomyces sp. NPDC052052 TaxID=3154756 RepID=UPI003414109A
MGFRKKTKNVSEIAEGKAKETLGKAVGNEKLESKGRAEKTKGMLKQAVEKGKDKFRH